MTDSQDHPRVCGEKHRAGPTRPRAGGSPPRMRGKARRARLFEVLRGITPAYAGKSMYHSFLTVDHWDHPRVCGEK